MSLLFSNVGVFIGAPLFSSILPEIPLEQVRNQAFSLHFTFIYATNVGNIIKFERSFNYENGSYMCACKDLEASLDFYQKASILKKVAVVIFQKINLLWFI